MLRFLHDNGPNSVPYLHCYRKFKWLRNLTGSTSRAINLVDADKFYRQTRLTVRNEVRI